MTERSALAAEAAAPAPDTSQDPRHRAGLPASKPRGREGEASQDGDPGAAASLLTHFLGLRPGWDGHPLTEPAKQGAVDDARRFLKNRPTDALAPVPGLHTTGDICLQWETDSSHASVHFEGDGKCHGYGYVEGQRGQRRESFWEDLEVDEAWPRDLEEIARGTNEK